MALGPPLLWDQPGPCHMGEGASFALEPPRPRPHGRGRLLRLGTTGAPYRMGKGASFALGPPRLPPHGRRGLLHFGTTKAPAAWARGPPSFSDHRGLHRMGQRASFALVSPTPPHG